MCESSFPWAPPYRPHKREKYCAKCRELREYTESPMDDGGTLQSCIVCGTCVGYSYPIEEHEPFVVDPYRPQTNEPMTLDQYMRMKGV